MVQKNRSIIGLFSLLGACILLSLISIQLTDGLIYNNHSDNNIINDELKTNTPPIYEINTFSIKIDNVNPNEDIGYHTWDWWVANYSWCYKTGDVYYIENIELSGGYYIAIVDSNVNFVIENCKVYESNRYGIKLHNVKNGKILNNNFSYNIENGIHLEMDCYLNEIKGNDIINNAENGIYLEEIQTSDWDIIFGTIYYYHPCDNNKIIDNIVNSNDFSGIKVSGFSNSHKTKNNNIEGNTANNNGYNGIHIALGDQHTVENNSVNDNGIHGLYMLTSNKNSILGNVANGNSASGIFLKYCSTSSNWNNELTNNTVSNNKFGIHLETSDHNYIGTGNIATGNTHYGIYLSEKSSNNKVIGNFVNNNAEYAICYEDDYCKSNIFEDNSDGAINLANPPSVNVGGNGVEYILTIVFVGFFIGLVGSIGYVNKTKKKKKIREEGFIEKNTYNRPRTVIHHHTTRVSLSHIQSHDQVNEAITPKHIASYEFYCSTCDKKSIGYQVFCTTCGERMKQSDLVSKPDTPEKITCVICHSSTCTLCNHDMTGEEICYEECPYCGRSYHKHCWDETITVLGKCGFCLETPPSELIPKSFKIKIDQEIKYTLEN